MQTISKIRVKDLLAFFSGAYREVFFEKSAQTGLSLLNGQIEPLSYSESSGFSVLSRTLEKQMFAAYWSLNQIEDDVRIFAVSNDLLEEAPTCELSGPDECMFSVRSLSEALLPFGERLRKLTTLAAQYDFITSYEAIVNLASKSYIVGNSRGSFGSDQQFYNTLFITVTWRRWDIHEEMFEKITGVDILNSLTDQAIECAFLNAVEKLEKVLDGSPAPSGIMDIVIGNEAGGTIIHEAVGHGLEADLQNSSVYKGKLGQKVAHESVTIVDDPTRPDLRGFYSVDHEGNSAQKTTLIKDGILISYMHHNKTAELFDTTSTGHGRRESYAYTTLVRMGSTYLAAGKDTKEELVARVTDGIYVAQMWGGQVNTVTGDFVFKVIYGYRIRNGKLAEVIRGANISGNGPNMLMDIEGIANDLSFFDGGTCGKGQSMPVSDATPTILVKLKVTGC